MFRNGPYQTRIDSMFVRDGVQDTEKLSKQQILEQKN
jgi:hypothetical protein